VIIPHYLGNVLFRCVECIERTGAGCAFEVIVVDDQPRDDGSIARALAAFPRTRVAKTHGAHGFGAACNAGIRAARGQYFVILNNDVEVAPGSLDAFVGAAVADPTIGIVQGKIRCIRDPTRFDYSGAAGGLIDWLGFPFALGRVFEDIEEDLGQYDTSRGIFWAVGSGLLVRRSCLEAVGLFDEDFYMHMEEIDLAWRVQLAGFRVVSCPAAVIYHWNGFTLRQGCFRKAFLNHRNNLVLLTKNLPATRLAAVVPLRIGLAIATIVYGVLRRDWRRPLASLLGMLWVFIHIRAVLQRRFAARATRQIPDEVVLRRMYPRSVVLDHFIRGRDVATIMAGTAIPTAAIRSPRAAAPKSVTPALEATLARR
jgi:GT2 family glycosyltransferase